MWGQFKDLIDELQSNMDKSWFKFSEPKGTPASAVGGFSATRRRVLYGARRGHRDLNADREAMAAKAEEHKPLEHEYEVYMTECKKRIEMTSLETSAPTGWHERKP